MNNWRQFMYSGDHYKIYNMTDDEILTYKAILGIVEYYDIIITKAQFTQLRMLFTIKMVIPGNTIQ